MYVWLLGAVAVLAALGFSYVISHPEGIIDGEHDGDVRSLVSSFSNQMDAVSLLAPDAAGTIRAVYTPYVASPLIEKWVADPSSAPGRLTSSPSPDHIEIESVTKTNTGIYEVTGFVVLTASEGDAGRVPVSLTVETIEGHLLITRYAEEGRGTPPTAPANVTLSIGQQIETLGISLRPMKLLEDSRCPLDVQCIQAGTVRVETQMIDGLGASTNVFVLNTPITAETRTITLTGVTPVPNSKETPSESDYRFTFHIEYR